MILVQFYLLTIAIIARNSQVNGSGYFTPGDLEYLSRRLYPEECSYLTNALSKNLSTDYKTPKQGSDDTLFDRPELHCLFELEEWNEMALKDEKANERMAKILHEIGRFDLATYLSKKLYSPY